MRIYVVKLLFFIPVFGLFTTANGFQQKTACFVDYVPSEDELEGEGPQRSSWPVGGVMAGSSYPGYNTDLRMPFGYPVDREDMMEQMGYGEMDEMEGLPYHPHIGHGLPWGTRGQPFPMELFRKENWSNVMGYPGHFLGEWGDTKRKRKRRRRKRQGYQQHSPMFLYGQLRCGLNESIHIHNVTLGYSVSPYCSQGLPGCQATSNRAKQVLNCQGKKGTCRVSLLRHFLSRCGKRVNFASANYECVPANRLVDICTNRNSDEQGAVVLSSLPSPSMDAARLRPTSDLVTCECTFRSASPSVFEIGYLRANLPGETGSCHGDLLLIEQPMPNQRDRYQMTSEICGANFSTGVTVINDNIVRVTFLGGAPVSEGTPGFMGKFQAKSPDGRSDLFHISCQTSLPQSEPDSKSTAAEASASASIQNDRSRLVNQLRDLLAKTGRSLPANFDPSSLPTNFFNMSRDELKKIISQEGGLESSAAILGSILDAISMETNEIEEKASEQSGSPDLLSGVVAALASVIVIMGSVGSLYFYTRWQKKRKKLENRADDHADIYAGDVSSSTGEHRQPRKGNRSKQTSFPRRPDLPQSSTAVYSIASTVPFSCDTDNPEGMGVHVVQVSKSETESRSPIAPPRRRKEGVPHVDEDGDDCCGSDTTDSETYDNARFSHNSDVVKPPPRRKHKSQDDIDDQTMTGVAQSDDNYTSIDEVITEVETYINTSDTFDQSPNNEK